MDVSIVLELGGPGELGGSDEERRGKFGFGEGESRREKRGFGAPWADVGVGERMRLSVVVLWLTVLAACGVLGFCSCDILDSGDGNHEVNRKK